MSTRGGLARSPVSVEMDSGFACQVRNLTVTYGIDGRDWAALRDIDLDIQEGKITAIIGESGSGKSTLALALMNAVSKPGQIQAGSVTYRGLGEVTAMGTEALRRLRGKSISMVFQASQNSMNPLTRIGAQLLDLARSHDMPNPRAVLREAGDLAERMSLDADRVLTSYQHQLSGGMRQRVGIIFGLVLKPEILLMDEPTTALDVLSQSSVLEIIRSIQQERQLTTVLITHDMGVVAELADRVVVLYAGRVVEEATTAELIRHPQHPYTQALIRAIPRLTGDPAGAVALAGQPPSLASIPEQGCVFRNRCPHRMEICETDLPQFHQVSDSGHRFACHYRAGDGEQGGVG